MRPRALRSLINCLQQPADSLSPLCTPKTFFWPATVTPMATSTGTCSTEPAMRILKLTPSKNRYLTGSLDRSLVRQRSMASVSSRFALETSSWLMDLPMRRRDIRDKVLVLTPERNIRERSSRIASSYRLLLGRTEFLNAPLRSLGTLTVTWPIPLRVNRR